MLKALIIIFIISMYCGQSFAVCDFNNNKCPVKPEFKKFLTKKFKRLGVAPAKNPMDGLKYIGVEEAIKLIGNPQYIFIDNRPNSFYKDCQIKGAVNYLYGVPSTPSNTLTQKIVQDFIKQGKTLIFYCNSLKCYRSLNAAIQSYAWGIDKKKIKWFGKGIVGIVNETKYTKYLKGDNCFKFKK